MVPLELPCRVYGNTLTRLGEKGGVLISKGMKRHEGVVFEYEVTREPSIDILTTRKKMT